ncbi:hypothetical protein N9D31_04280, partial [Oligoflexaceae bacterium]|nr:hypothetical protein [Oligoflexaceae bacterium]
QEISLDPRMIARFHQKQDPMQIQGSITVRPPKGHCFTVQTHNSLTDVYVCEEQNISFNASMLDWSGSLKMTIKTGPADLGHQYVWPSPYRRAQTIKMGERPKHLYDGELILKCEAFTEAGDRRLVLTLLKDKKWVIRFPKKDVYKKPPLRGDTRFLSSSESESLEKKGLGELGTALPDYKRALANAKKGEPVETYWMNDEEGAYTMAAENFSTADSPAGSKGECLYKYQGAYRDSYSGWIECRHSDRHDVIYAPLTCSNQILRSKMNKN